MTRLVLQNLADEAQQAWAFVGMPMAAPDVGICQPQGWPAFAVPGGVMVRANLDAMATAETDLQPGQDASIPQLDPEVVKAAKNFVPRFLGWTRDRQPRWSEPLAFLSEAPHGRGFRFTWRTRILGPVDLTIDGTTTVWPDAKIDAVEMQWRATWGTTASPAISADLDELVMVTGAMPVIDHASRKGLLPATWNSRLNAYQQTIATPRTWGRAATIEWEGRLFAGHAWEEPITGVCAEWAGKFGALGVLPVAPPNAEQTSQQRYDEFMAHTAMGAPLGDEYDDRPMGLAKQAGQTGGEEDFGCMEGEEAVVQLKPWAVHDYAYNVQEWGLRPTGNKEPDGSPVTAARHPRCTTYNQIPFDRLSQDMLGWPNPMPWDNSADGYSTEDDQHRSDHLLIADWLLRRSPNTEAKINDLIELDLMRVATQVGAWIASPRDWGRRLKSYADYVACGFTKALPLLQTCLDALDAGSSWRRIPQDAAHPVRVFSNLEAKYGWTTDQCVAWWQEVICQIGCYAAWKATGDARALTLALTSAESVTRFAFSNFTGDWRVAYATRWRMDDPGAAQPDEAIPLDGPSASDKVFGYAPMVQWTIPACIIAQRHSTDAAVRGRAAAILAAFPVQSWADSRWRAL